MTRKIILYPGESFQFEGAWKFKGLVCKKSDISFTLDHENRKYCITCNLNYPKIQQVFRPVMLLNEIKNTQGSIQFHVTIGQMGIASLCFTYEGPFSFNLSLESIGSLTKRAKYPSIL